MAMSSLLGDKIGMLPRIAIAETIPKIFECDAELRRVLTMVERNGPSGTHAAF